MPTIIINACFKSLFNYADNIFIKLKKSIANTKVCKK